MLSAENSVHGSPLSGSFSPHKTRERREVGQSTGSRMTRLGCSLCSQAFSAYPNHSQLILITLHMIPSLKVKIICEIKIVTMLIK